MFIDDFLFNQCNCTSANLESWFLVDQMVSLGHTTHFGTTLLSVMGISNMFGRILCSVLKMRKKSFPTVYNMFYVCPMLVLGHTLMILLQTLDKWIFAASLVHGFAYGLLIAFTPVILYDLVGGDMFPQAVSLLNLAFGIGNMMGNFLGGNICVFKLCFRLFNMFNASNIWYQMFVVIVTASHNTFFKIFPNS